MFSGFVAKSESIKVKHQIVMRKIHPRLFHPTTCFILLFQSHSVILDMSFPSFHAQERHCCIRTNIDGQEQFGPIRTAISSCHLEKAK